MRRLFGSLAGATLMSLVVAGTALGSHCINESKQADAGQKVSVIIDVTDPTAAPTFVGTHNGRLTGGFIDVWLDLDGNGSPDLLACDDAFLVSNHSPNGAASGQSEGEGEPATLPVVIRGDDPGGAGNGVGSC